MASNFYQDNWDGLAVPVPNSSVPLVPLRHNREGLRGRVGPASSWPMELRVFNKIEVNQDNAPDGYNVAFTFTTNPAATSFRMAALHGNKLIGLENNPVGMGSNAYFVISHGDNVQGLQSAIAALNVSPPASVNVGTNQFISLNCILLPIVDGYTEEVPILGVEDTYACILCAAYNLAGISDDNQWDTINPQYVSPIVSFYG